MHLDQGWAVVVIADVAAPLYVGDGHCRFAARVAALKPEHRREEAEVRTAPPSLGKGMCGSAVGATVAVNDVDARAAEGSAASCDGVVVFPADGRASPAAMALNSRKTAAIEVRAVPRLDRPIEGVVRSPSGPNLPLMSA